MEQMQRIPNQPLPTPASQSKKRRTPLSSFFSKVPIVTCFARQNVVTVCCAHSAVPDTFLFHSGRRPASA
ncbi:similar to maestro (predicted), isoform CRA_a [Rattus norvegicus]|uniref:Similar to maestro (Predicted), isoform CRA_a n=1 Tax=Rattus norvegicus TaxID=10116 RepID=A6KRC7_RAT|nr:similar to maestro (predicted), isoform CRA_a [Rattus norvegicus]